MGISTVSSKEKAFLFALSAFLIVITSLPYLWGYLKTPSGKYFLGVHLAPGDVFVYENYLEQARQGYWNFTNYFHNEPFSDTYFNAFWLLLGQLGKVFPLNSYLIFHLGRIALIPFLVFILYRLISLFFASPLSRASTLVISIFASGWGGLLAPLLYPLRYINLQDGYYNWPQDLWVAESNTFLTIYQSPHFILSLTFLLSIYYLLLLFLKNNQKKYLFISGFIGLIYFNFHPFYLINIFSTLLLYGIVLWGLGKNKLLQRTFLFTIALLVFSLPSLLYLFSKMYFDSHFYLKSLQNLCPTVSLGLLFISYGFLVLLGGGGMYLLAKKKKLLDYRYLFLFVWVIVNFVLIYSPLRFQRRLVMGLNIPLSIFTVYALFQMNSYFKKYYFFSANCYLRRLLFTFLIIVFSSSNIYTIEAGFKVLPSTNIDKNIVQAMRWSACNTPSSSSFLASPFLGGLIPAFSFRHVYLGHPVETINYQEKLSSLYWFFKTNKSDQQKKEFLKNSRIDYIFFSFFEKKLGNFNPEEKKYLKKVYQNSAVTIYQFMD